MEPRDDGWLCYEPPTVVTVGTVSELTQSWCVPVFDKTIGPPDYFVNIPITTCSS
jgi:hypothetical protein